MRDSAAWFRVHAELRVPGRDSCLGSLFSRVALPRHLRDGVPARKDFPTSVTRRRTAMREGCEKGFSHQQPVLHVGPKVARPRAAGATQGRAIETHQVPRADQRSSRVLDAPAAKGNQPTEGQER